jgi:sporulation protein YlmC with PRC-barrel domain
VNSKDLKGLSVINVTDGAKVGTVERAFLDPARKQIVGFAIDTGGGFLSPESSLLADTIEVRSLGSGALTLDNATPRGGDTSARYGDLVDLATVVGREVFTESGALLGHVGEAAFDDGTYALSEIEVVHGVLQHRRTVPIGQVLTIGPEVVVVSAGAAPSGDTG